MTPRSTWVALALIAMGGGCGDDPVLLPDAAPTPDAAPAADAAPASDGPVNLGDFAKPYTCDPQTALLYHFDADDPLAEGCDIGVGELTVGTGTQASATGPMPGFADAASFDRSTMWAGSDLGTTGFLDALTLEFWIYSTREAPSMNSVDQVIVRSATSEPVQQSVHRQFQVAITPRGTDTDGDSNVQFALFDSDCQNTNNNAVIIVPITVDTWTHYRAVYNGDVLTVRVDGVLGPSTANSVAPSELCTGGPTTLTIGARQENGPPDLLFQGYLDELRISTVAR